MAEQHIYRAAIPNDEAGILKVFEEVAPEVPTRVYPEETAKMIERLIATGQSWVAIDNSGTIMGYALAEMNGGETSLNYIGVAKKARGQHVCSALISKLKETDTPINTDVRSNNTSSMVERFERLGFIKCDPDIFSEDRTKLRWESKGTPKPNSDLHSE